VRKGNHVKNTTLKKREALIFTTCCIWK